MKIGLLLLATGRQAGGPETYEAELVRSLAKIDQQNEYFVYCTEDAAPQVIGVKQENVNYRLIRPRNRWAGLLVGLHAQMWGDGVDVLHCTYAPPPFASDYVFTMHCVSNLVHPEFYGRSKVARLNALHKRGLGKAKRILCVSDYVRQQIIQNYGVEESRTSVVYNGVCQEWYRPGSSDADQSVLRKHGIDRPYILYVGKLQARKNILRLLKAYELFRNECSSDTLLVMAGRRTETDVGIDEAIAASQYSNDIRHIGYLPPPSPGMSSDLPSLYRGARIFVLPSLFEGFGIPLIEAMAAGIPIVTSNITSLPEIAGDAALLFDPLSEESIAERLVTLERSPELRVELVKRGQKRAGLFTWDACARQTLEAYELALPA
jgi:alpha-1,3-rhamnosyl/mannosyltransferase